MNQFLQNLENLTQGLIDAPWARILAGVRWTFLFFDAFLVVAFILVFREARSFRPPLSRKSRPRTAESPFDQKLLGERWTRIVGGAPQSPPQSYVLAIIEADKLVDDSLKVMGIEGEHMADRLEKLRAEEYPTLDRLWRAHRVRNDLVHTPDFEIHPGDAEDVLKIYEKFLKELGALSS